MFKASTDQLLMDDLELGCLITLRADSPDATKTKMRKYLGKKYVIDKKTQTLTRLGVLQAEDGPNQVSVFGSLCAYLAKQKHV